MMPNRNYDWLDVVDVAECRAMLRTGSHSFFASSLLLPRAVRDPASALYAFCRVADDAVDDNPDRRFAIDELYRRLDRAYAGEPLDFAADRGFSRVVRDCAIPRALPEALLEGLQWDVAGRRYETLSELYDYAARVAGTVGVMMAVIMRVEKPDVLARACDLGVAMQLTNIARDVGEDARAGRLYLPLCLLDAAGIDAERWLERPVFSEALGGVIQQLLDAADRLYERSTAGIAQLPVGCRPGIFAARLIYAEIGRRLEALGLDSVSQRAVVSRSRKIQLLGNALLATARPRFRDRTPALKEVQFLVDAASAVRHWPY